ncbi:MAG TPA: DUF692 domain-containing protein [Chromatiales bacterium]|nr:DUF692 domain-containing protein [Chromatiales bacterium]
MRSSESVKFPDLALTGAGIGLRAVHYPDAISQPDAFAWAEVHPENYMGAGGPPHHYLTAVRETHPLSLHGVGLSLAGADPVDVVHLKRLKALIDRYEPVLCSEHLAWSSHDGRFLNDLLPVPYTEVSLQHLARRIDQVQDTLGQSILIENPARYLTLSDSDMAETVFLEQLVQRTGCGLLLDVNNVFVSAVNLGFDAARYIAQFPAAAVGEIHVAGHAPDPAQGETGLLIDSHDRAVDEQVWQLLEYALARTGPVPVLVEWDRDWPEWSTLLAEAQRADEILDRTARADILTEKTVAC